jgi:hypothetical protein
VKFEILVKWTIMNIGGAIAASFIGLLILSRLYPSAPINTLPKSILFGIIFSIVFEFAQLSILRKYLIYSNRWAIMTILAFTLLSIITKILDRFGILLPPTIIYFVSGGIIGYFQYLVLRKEFGHAQWWILTIAISWLSLSELVAANDQALTVLGYLAFGLLPGAVFMAYKPKPIYDQKADNIIDVVVSH